MTAAFVLAGGRSSRMGSDKAFLELGRRTLLTIALEKAAAVAQEVSIVGPRSRLAFLGLPVTEDIYENAGPLAAIHAALSFSKAELNLILGVDTPFLQPEFLRFLVEEANRTGAVVTTPRVHGEFEPLCSVYRAAFLDVAEGALRAGERRITPLFAQVALHTIEESEIQRFESGTAMFDNLNTPADLERAQALRVR